jgi:polyhydroxyalkanoate synthesis regulator phasin
MSDLTDTIKEASKIVTDKYKKKIENIVEGIKATPSYFKKKKVNKKYGETDLLKGKNYYPPKP